MDNSTNRRISL